jgi:hypothetical protein
MGAFRPAQPHWHVDFSAKILPRQPNHMIWLRAEFPGNRVIHLSRFEFGQSCRPPPDEKTASGMKPAKWTISLMARDVAD